MRTRAESGQFIYNPDGLQPKILKLVEDGETSRKVMAETAGITQKQVARVLSNLVSRRLIEECGEMPNGRRKPVKVYRVKGSEGFTFRQGPINSVFSLANSCIMNEWAGPCYPP